MDPVPKGRDEGPKGQDGWLHRSDGTLFGRRSSRASIKP
jgi:hypothetical protein